MGQITAVEPQKKKTDRFNIFLDEKFAFGLSGEAVFSNKIKVGQDLDPIKVKKLIETDQEQRLVEKAILFLGFRPRSEKETRDHLTFKGKLRDLETAEEKSQYADSIERAIKRLKDLNYLDDLEFARWWVEQRETFRKTSKRLLSGELIRKGIDKETIAQVLEKGTPEAVKAQQLAEKKVRLLKNRPKDEIKIKLGQYLARAGFDWDLIKKVVDSLLQKS